MTIREHVQRPNLGAEITLYEIDLTQFGAGIIRITPGTDGAGAAIEFGGQTYAPHPIDAEGFELTGDGPLPRPKITVANIDDALTPLIEQNDDLQGALVRRIRTYDRYLDNGATPDPDAHKPIDLYQISRKTADDGEIVSWELSALMDQEGVELPGRKIVRDYCDHTVRRWNAALGQFDYSDATCPYMGDPKDENGDPCAPADEVFSKRLATCCQARFGQNEPLPTRAFPGVARIRAR